MKTLLHLASVAVLVCFASAVRAESPSELASKLKDQDATVRRKAADQLGQLGGEAKSAIPALIKALGDEDLFVRRFAAQALGKIGPDAKDAVPALSKLVGDERKEVAEAAAQALGKIGGASVVKPLMDTAADTGASSMARRRAIQALGKLGPEAKSAVPALLSVLTAKEKKKKKGAPAADDLRPDAVNALGEIGPDAKAALPTLTEIATAKKGKNKDLKRAAAEAVKKIEKN